MPKIPSIRKALCSKASYIYLRRVVLKFFGLLAQNLLHTEAWRILPLSLPAFILIRVRVELTKDVDKKDQNAFEAKGTIELRGPNFIVSTFSDNLYNAIDDLEDKLLRKLRNRARLMKTKRKEAYIGG